MRTQLVFYPSVFVLAAVVILATAAPARAQTVVITEVDNQTNAGVPDTNNKNGSQYVLFGTGTRIYSTFPEFGVAESSSYNFFVDFTTGPANLQLYESVPYNPDTITFNNQPALGVLVGSVVVNGAGWYSISTEGHDTRRLVLTSVTAEATYISVYASLNPPRIEYTAAPGTKPPPPTNCYNFEDNTDFLNSADFALNPIASVGEMAAVVDAGLHTADGGTVATFPSLATSANNGFTIAGWWQINDEFDTYELVAADNNHRLFIEGGTQNTVHNPSGNTISNYTALADGWNYVGGGIAADGVGHVMVNTNHYTATIDPPLATASTLDLVAPANGRVDQLMFWNDDLTRDNHLWLWNGGRGRSCYEFGLPSQVITYTISIEPSAAPFTSTLPLGNQLDFFLTATVGEMAIALSVLSLTVVTLLVAVRWYAGKDNQ